MARGFSFIGCSSHTTNMKRASKNQPPRSVDQHWRKWTGVEEVHNLSQGRIFACWRWGRVSAIILERKKCPFQYLNLSGMGGPTPNYPHLFVSSEKASARSIPTHPTPQCAKSGLPLCSPASGCFYNIASPRQDHCILFTQSIFIYHPLVPSWTLNKRTVRCHPKAAEADMT